MSKFDLDKLELYDILLTKGINKLFHANTVATSITFLNQKNLLSREYAEHNNLPQTSQYTDEKDRKLGIYNDIFLDFVDIHSEWRRFNKYGPFLFVFSIEILKSDLIETVRITRSNPSGWNVAGPEDNQYYSDIKEFEKHYKKGNKLRDVGTMLILKNVEGKLPLEPFLEKMVFDNPNLFINHKNQKLYLSNLVGAQLKEIVDHCGY
jgi:hypothetical protein